MTDHVQVVACASGEYDVFSLDVEDSDAGIAAGVAKALAHHREGDESVIVIRNGAVARQVHGEELAGLKASVAEARRAAVASWWKAAAGG